MFRANWKWLMIAVVAVATVVGGVSQANAWCFGSSYGYGGWGYGSYYSGCYGHGCGYGWGHGWGCGWGGWCHHVSCWNCAGCYDTCCGDPCCGFDVGCCGTAAPAVAAPAEGQSPTPAPPQTESDDTPAPPPPPAQTRGVPTRANSGLLTIWVPGGAKVIVNGLQTKSAGSRRRYVSHGLKPGLSYRYEISAQVVRDGELLEETKVVHLKAGAQEGVAFGFNEAAVEELAAAR